MEGRAQARVERAAFHLLVLVVADHLCLGLKQLAGIPEVLIQVIAAAVVAVASTEITVLAVGAVEEQMAQSQVAVGVQQDILEPVAMEGIIAVVADILPVNPGRLTLGPQVVDQLGAQVAVE